MKNKLFLIGNGFDLAHNLPTKFDPDLKSFFVKNEGSIFWDLYQTRESDIWSDFENLLGHPDFNSLEKIFEGFEPDYSSDRESDRDCIIRQAELFGNLRRALDKFVKNAESKLSNTEKKVFIEQMLSSDGYYISFNYTHTLENVYDIPSKRILHIHGEAGKDNLVLGYPQGCFKPNKYVYDVRQKGHPPYAELEIEEFINNIECYYTRTAYANLIDKCKSFYKEINIEALESFLDANQVEADEIIVYGHSCKIDFDYFVFLNGKYPKARWRFYVFDSAQEKDVKSLVNKCNINDIDYCMIH